MTLVELFSPLAIFLGALGLAGLVATSWMAVRSWALLPATVACHFDLLGQPDSFGSKRCLWVFPVLSTAMYVALGAFLCLWDLSNGETVERTRRNVECLMGVPAWFAWVGFFTTRGIIAIGLGRRKGLGRWFCLTILGVLALLIFVGSLRLR